MSSLTNELKPKSFWDRKEGTTGMITIGLGVLGLAFAGPFLMGVFATLITLLGQGITIAVLGTVLFALIMIISNKKFQTLVSYMFKSSMRKITGAFVEIDPIGIMKNYVRDLGVKRESMNESISKLRGQLTLCKKQIDENSNEFEKQMQLFKVAREKGMMPQSTVHARQAERLERVNMENLKPIYAQMEMHLRTLNKYHEVTGVVIADLQNEVTTQTRLREMITSSHNAMSMAKKIIMGGTDERELFDMAMESVVNDYGVKLGAIEQFIENSKGFVEGLDLQNGVADEKALARLKAWESQTDDVLLGNKKQQLLEQVPASNSPYSTIPATAAIDYEKTFNYEKAFMK